MTPGGKNDNRGFTLLEVLVAISLLSISFLVVSQLFSGSLRLAGLNESYCEATALADQKMDEFLQTNEKPAEEGLADSGEYEDRFKWEVNVNPYEGLVLEEDQTFPFELFTVQVKVTWSEGERQRSISLQSVKSFKRSDEG